MPVPRADVVRNADEAAAAANRIGFPVAVKPLDGNHGRGVILNLADEAAVRDGYAIARRESPRGGGGRELPDRQRLPLPGDRWRLRAVAQRIPPTSTATARTRSELIDSTNADPRRGIGHEKVLTRINVDEESIAYAREQGFGLTDVPPRRPASS